MIDVYFYGTLRSYFQKTHISVQAKTIKELINTIQKCTGMTCKNELKNALTFVNEVNFLLLKKYNTPLKSGDKVAFLSPASGG